MRKLLLCPRGNVLEWVLKGGIPMKYTVKWLEDNLGITRKALRNYEAKGLLSSEASRNPSNNYREYDEEDIDRIWSIKILQGVGYSLSEIRELIDNPEADFYKSISEKVVELERKRDDITRSIEFAKTIKLTGRAPNTKEVGSVKYSEFMEYSRENWNFYTEPDAASYLEAMESIQEAKNRDLTEQDIEKLEALADLMDDFQEMQRTCMINAFYQIIASMQSLSHDNEAVQAVVKQLFLFLSESETAKEIGEKYTPVFFAKYTAPFFLEGSDIGEINIVNHGKEGAEFIARAIAYFGGFNTLDELLDHSQ